MRIHQTCLYLLLALITITLVSCSSDSSSPTTPSLGTNVAGTWAFSGQITSNNCSFLQDNPSFQIGVPLSDWFVVTQNGMNLTAVDSVGDLAYSGTVSGNSFSMAQTNPSTVDFNGCTVSSGTGLQVDRSTETAGTGSVNITFDALSGNCTGACSVIYLGNWTKTN